MRDGYAKLQALGVEVYGVSFDSVEVNREFAEKNAFPFRLLSDEDHRMAVAFGAATDATAARASRKSYLIDGEGRVTHIIDPVRIDTHLDDVLRALGAAP